MKSPSEKTIKRLFALSGNQCAYPQCQTLIVQKTGTVTGKVCHVKGKSPGGPRYDKSQTDEARHSFENLILLCSVHHDIIDNEPDRHPVELLLELKEMKERRGFMELSQEDARLAQKLYESSCIRIEAHDESQVMVQSPGAVQARNYTIKTTKKKVVFQAPSDAIASNLQMRNYTKHLIDRYNDCQKRHVEKTGKGKYIAIHNAIKTEFGAKWDLVSQRRFPDLVAYLQMRIEETRWGRYDKSHGFRCYETYEDYLAKFQYD